MEGLVLDAPPLYLVHNHSEQVSCGRGQVGGLQEVGGPLGSRQFLPDSADEFGGVLVGGL